MKSFLTLALFTVGAALAQMGGGPPTPGTTEIKTYLGLSDSQVPSLQAIQKQAQTAVQNLQTQIRQKQSDLDSQLSKGTTDAAAVGKLLIDITSLRKQVDSTLAPYRAQAQAVLTTTDQKNKLKTLDDASKLQTEIREAVGLLLITPANPGGFGFGGPGGFGGPAGFGGRPGPGPRGFRPPEF